jgi:hypothetical protein
MYHRPLRLRAESLFAGFAASIAGHEAFPEKMRKSFCPY